MAEQPQFFSKEAIESLLGYEIENFHYEVTYDMEGKIIRCDIHVSPKKTVDRIHLDFKVVDKNNEEFK